MQLIKNTPSITHKHWKPLFVLSQEEEKKRLVSVQLIQPDGTSILITPTGDILSIEEICNREYNGFNPLENNSTFDEYLTNVAKLIEYTRTTSQMPSLIDTIASINSSSANSNQQQI